MSEVSPMQHCSMPSACSSTTCACAAQARSAAGNLVCVGTPVNPLAQGLYASSPHHQSTLGFLAHVFEEDLTHHTPAKVVASSNGQDGQHIDAQQGQHYGQHDGQHDGQPSEEGPNAHIGPMMPPGWQPPPSDTPSEEPQDECTGSDAAAGSMDNNHDDTPAHGRRVVGPAMPSAADLAAAAACTPHDVDDTEDDDLVGPPPPDFLLVVPAGSSVTAEQMAEVSRVLQLLAEARSVHPPPPPGEQPLVDPYSVLGVAPDAARSDIKYVVVPAFSVA